MIKKFLIQQPKKNNLPRPDEQMATALLLSLNLTTTTTPPSLSPQHHHHQNLTPIFHHRTPTRTKFPRIPSSSPKNNNETECPVPLDQQPINEFNALSTSFPFSWASGEVTEYSARLFATGASFALFVGLPVSWFGSVGAKSEPVRVVLAAACSGIFVVTLVVVNMYLGWAYVGNRLLSATVEYEETGWYDGQVWVKNAEVLARDRLLGSFSVKPVLGRLKNTLVVLGATLFVCILLLINSESIQKNIYVPSEEPSGRAVPGVYNEESARSFEPEAFCGEPSVPEQPRG